MIPPQRLCKGGIVCSAMVGGYPKNDQKVYVFKQLCAEMFKEIGAQKRRPSVNDINNLSVKLFMINSGLCLHWFTLVFNGVVELASKV